MNNSMLKSATFQKQTIKAGSILFSFKYSAFVKVIALTECGPNVCAVFEYGHAEFVKELNSSNFCTVPTDEEVNKNLKELNRDINQGCYHRIVSVFSGKLVTNPAFENKVIEGEISFIVQYLSKEGIDRVFIQSKITASSILKTTIPVKPFLNVFFADRRKKFEPNRPEDRQIRASLKDKLNTEYNCELKLIGGLRQHPEGLSFSEWIARRI